MAGLRREEYQEREYRARRRSDAARVKNMILYDDSAFRLQRAGKFSQQLGVFRAAFAVNNVRHENRLMTAGDFVCAIVPGYQSEAPFESGVSNIMPGERERAWQVEDRNSQLGQSLTQINGIRRGSGTDIEQLSDTAPI